jgi:hypothetical protein
MHTQRKQTKSMTSSKFNDKANEPLPRQVELWDEGFVADDHAEGGLTSPRGTAAVVVFTTTSRFSPWFILYMLAVSLLCVSLFVILLYSDLTYVGEDPLTSQILDQCVLYSVLLLAIFLMIVLLLVPRRYQVFSDATIAVQSTLASFKFGSIQDAQRNSSLCETARLRWDFSVDLTNRVFVERSGNKWQVSCSPQDPDGFVHAIRHVCGVPTTAETAV